MHVLDWWESLSQEQRDISLIAAIVPPPVSLDTLVKVSSISPVKILRLIEDLLERGVFSLYKPLGKGYYYYTKTVFVDVVLKNSAQEDIKNAASKLIAYLEK